MGKIIRKQIDLSNEIVVGLKILAAMKDTNTKRYIEALVIEHVRANIDKVKQLGMLKK